MWENELNENVLRRMIMIIIMINLMRMIISNLPAMAARRITFQFSPKGFAPWVQLICRIMWKLQSKDPGWLYLITVHALVGNLVSFISIVEDPFVEQVSLCLELLQLSCSKPWSTLLLEIHQREFQQLFWTNLYFPYCITRLPVGS